MIKALNDSIIFTFEDAVRNGQFMEQTASGLYLGFVKEESAQAARYGRVKAVGHKVRDVKVGDRILIEPLMWSDAFKVENQKFWRTTEEKVLAIDVG
jgi:co-chaperonin GroES (HSP10)